LADRAGDALRPVVQLRRQAFERHMIKAIGFFEGEDFPSQRAAGDDQHGFPRALRLSVHPGA
jgi:hypothetical protein